MGHVVSLITMSAKDFINYTTSSTLIFDVSLIGSYLVYLAFRFVYVYIIFTVDLHVLILVGQNIAFLLVSEDPGRARTLSKCR